MTSSNAKRRPGLITQGLLGLVGATASAAYLDAKFHISKDATLIRKFKEAERRYLQARESLACLPCSENVC